MRSRLLKTTVLAAVAGARWTQIPQVTLRLNRRRRVSLKCWFMGHEDWIRRTPDCLYLECFECGRETPGWVTGKNRAAAWAGGAFKGAPENKHKDHSARALVRKPMKPSARSERSITHQVAT